MPFPKSHDKIFDFQTDEIPADFEKRLSLEISKHHYKIENKDGKLTYSSRKSIGGFVFKVSFEFSYSKHQTSIKVSVGLERLLNITLAVILLASLTSAFSVGIFLWFSAGFSLLFYFLNISLVFSEISSFFSKATGQTKKEELGKKQIEWMNRPDRCPACGAEINSYSWECHSCGLHVGRKKNFSRFNTTLYNKKFTYKYKGQ